GSLPNLVTAVGGRITCVKIPRILRQELQILFHEIREKSGIPPACRRSSHTTVRTVEAKFHKWSGFIPFRESGVHVADSNWLLVNRSQSHDHVNSAMG
ncbi:MAG: hypothetical protein KDA80_24385, partial [Planctomycetaceae bacterium]|nr:hypothetical protein [Planctomycetaceae bacterium]